MFWSLINNSYTNTAQQWAAILTVIGELLFIAGAFVGLGGWLLRWQRKKDRAEEEHNREEIKREVAYQIETFKDEFIEYFETRMTDITAGVNRTVSAVETNGGSSMADAVNRIERKLEKVEKVQTGINKKVGELDSKVKSQGDEQ